MKIIGIKFMNLNSLKGEHEIIFNESPFAEAGMFAITGPTGAGKTTILDAITIALYGAVHRHGRDVDECMTRFTGESYSEVTFETNAKQFRARWSNRRARGKATGNIQGAKMELAEATTNTIIISHPVQAVKDRIVELCGLDYEQFTRSVMLCQGEFTRFLKAKENERSELLEKITDTGIYSEISIFVHGKMKEEQAALKELQSALGYIEIMSEEQVAALDEDLKSLVLKLKDSSQKQTDTEAKVKWLQQLSALKLKISQQEEEVAKLMLLRKESTSRFAQLNLHLKALAYKPDLVQIKEVQNQLVEQRRKAEDFNDRLPQLRRELETIQTDLANAKAEQDKREAGFQQAMPIWDKVSSLDAHIEVAASRVDQLRKEEELITGDISIKEIALKQAEEALRECKARLDWIESWFGEHKQEAYLEKQLPRFFKDIEIYEDEVRQSEKAGKELQGILKKLQTGRKELTQAEEAKRKEAQGLKAMEEDGKKLQIDFARELEGVTLNEWETQRDGLLPVIRLFEEQMTRSAAFVKYTLEIEALETEIQQQHDLVQEEQAALEDTKTRLQESEEKLLHLQTIFELQLRIKKYEDDRKELKPDCPCPLCGSQEHPYVEGSYNHDLSAAEQARESQKAIRNEWNKKVLLQSSRLSQLNTALSGMRAKLDELRGLKLQQEESFAAASMPDLFPFIIGEEESISGAIWLKKEHRQAVEEKIRVLKELKTRIEEYEKNEASKREALLKMEGDLALLSERQGNLETEEKKIREDIESWKCKLQNKLEAIQNFLQPHNLDLPGTSIAQAKETLKQRAITYAQLDSERQSKMTEKDVFGNEVQNARAFLSEAAERLVEHMKKNEAEKMNLESTSSQRQNIFGDKDLSAERLRFENALSDARQSRSSIEELFHELQKNLNTDEAQLRSAEDESRVLTARAGQLTEDLLTKILKNGFVSLQALEECFLSDAVAESLKTEQHKLEQEAGTAESMLRSFQSELGHVLAKEMTADTEDTLALELQELEDEIALINQEIGGIQNQLLQYAEKRKQFSKIADKIASQKMESERWERLSSLIGSADGKKFRAFAQSLTLGRLTELANRHLKKFSDRYRIVKSDDKELELQIVDSYQADTQRPVSSLSGGESFLVSLSLALGLSDLAGRKASIQSLFIDEGFGTLDAETLDVAISALENLQARGKVIGIISHVEALKERIGTQIEVEKQHGGHSKIKICAYGVELVS